MITVYSHNSDFNIFVEKVFSDIGIIPLFFDDASKLESFKSLDIKNFLIFLDEPSRSKVERICESVRNNFPISNIAVAVKDSTRFREIENIDKQIIIPCSENIFKQMIHRYFCFPTSCGVLKFEHKNRGVTLLGYPLTLSKTDYSIVKFLVLSKEKPLSPEIFSELLNISNTCLSTHIGTVNKKAFALTNRKLIIHTKHGYMLNPYM